MRVAIHNTGQASQRKGKGPMNHNAHGYPVELLDMYVRDVMHSRRHLSFGASMCIILPVIVAVALLVAAILPEIFFFAECQNIPGGDICTITVQ